MSELSFTTRTYTHKITNPALPGKQRADLCVRASIAEGAVGINLLVVPNINSIDGSVNLHRLPVWRGDNITPLEEGVRRIGIGLFLGRASTDGTPEIVYRTVEALFAAFGGSVTVGQEVQPYNRIRGTYMRPLPIATDGFSAISEVPTLNEYLHPATETLDIPRAWSTDIGATALSALIQLHAQAPDAFQNVTDFSVNLPPVNIAHVQRR